jgi:cytochrome d ubiquinol oxidase subunit II
VRRPLPFAKDHERDKMQAARLCGITTKPGSSSWRRSFGFPETYAALMPALYLPIFLMLLALIFRGVAFEFRHHGRKTGKKWWTFAFSAGSITAAAAQGLVLGGFIQGVNVVDGEFVGGPLDWLTPFSLLVAASLVAGYALLGAGWIVFKTEGELFERARGWVKRLALLSALGMGAVSLATLSVDPRITERWGLTMTSIDWPVLARALPLVAGACFLLWRGADLPAPYLYGVGLFVVGMSASQSASGLHRPFEMTRSRRR